jgi:hypothetical protein
MLSGTVLDGQPVRVHSDGFLDAIQQILEDQAVDNNPAIEVSANVTDMQKKPAKAGFFNEQ